MGHLVEQWTRKQFQTRVKIKAEGGAFYHIVAVTGACLFFETKSRQRPSHTHPYMHAPPLHTTGFLGFVDDMAVELACVEIAGDAAAGASNSTIVVRIQSEQRFGTLDAGFNKRRVASLIAYINRQSHGLPAGPCSLP